MLDLRTLARALGGEVAGNQVLAPGPGHSPRDRSLSVRLSATAPDGFVVHSFAGDDWRAGLEHVRESLGLPPREKAPRRPPDGRRRPPKPPPEDDDREQKIAAAIALWRQCVDPRGTLAERYLAGRGLVLDSYIADEVLGWNPAIGAMVALFRNIETNKPQAISRTYLDAQGRRRVHVDPRTGKETKRWFLGPVGGAAVMLDPFDSVLGGLHVGEGVETCMTARQHFGLRPTWALGSAGAVRRFRSSAGSRRSMFSSTMTRTAQANRQPGRSRRAGAPPDAK